MIRRVLLLSAGILTSALAAHAQPTCDANMLGAFKNKIKYIVSPTTPGPGAPLPGTGSFPASPPNPDYVGDLGDAFCGASSDFQSALGTLAAIYIDPTCQDGAACFEDSWGWLRNLPNGTTGRYIGLSASLWTVLNPATPYSSFETQLQMSLMPNGVGVSYSMTPDIKSIALIAALAHEMGHIAYQVEVPFSSPANFCGGAFFQSWVAATVNPPPYWRDLLTPTERDNIRGGPHGRWPYIHAQPPQIDSIDHPGSGDPPASQLIFKLVADSAKRPDGTVIPGAPWASPFASIAPDEDFVETYKFKVLTTANVPLTSESIRVQNGLGPGMDGMANIVADYINNGRPQLRAKANCVQVSF